MIFIRLIIAIFFYNIFFVGYAQLRIRVKFKHVYKQDDYDAGNLDEPTWFLHVRDAPDIDGVGWRGGNCHHVQCQYYGGWLNNICPNNHGNPNTTEFDVTYNYNNNNWLLPYKKPDRLELYFLAWEDDTDPDCEYNTGPFINNDDGYQLSSIQNIDYESLGPPCSWNGGDHTNTVTNYFSDNQKWGVSIQVWYKYNFDPNGLYIWNGKVDNDWFSPCNWYTSIVPDATDDVLILASANHMPTVKLNSSANGQAAGQAYCNTLEVENGAKVTIENGAKLNVTQ